MVAMKHRGKFWIAGLVVMSVAGAAFLAGYQINQAMRYYQRDRDMAQQFADWDAGTQTLGDESLQAAVIRLPPSDAARSYQGRIESIKDAQLRETIAAVYPACVAVGSGSGVCISAEGDVLTNAHVALGLGRQMIVKFPDGSQAIMTCRALNRRLDLAVVTAATGAPVLPFAPIASDPPRVGQTVVCVGQPDPSTPDGQPTGFEPFHVSVGHIIALRGNPTGEQQLGSVKHDAWTYWGHSGSPLFDERGCVIALHNSWDAAAGQRHAIPQQAIVKFLREAGVTFTER